MTSASFLENWINVKLAQAAKKEAEVIFVCALVSWCAQAQGESPPAPFKLAFVSNREHYWYPHVYLYEHDGKSSGKVTGSIDPQDKRLDHQPVLSTDGKILVFGLEMEGQVGQLRMWDVATNQARDLTDLFRTPNAVFSPSLSGDGKLLAISAWNRPGSSARWDILLFDLTQRQAIELPGLNSSKYDERRVSMSGNGEWLAYTSNSPDGCGLTDIRLYNRQSKEAFPLLEMNSPATDSFPSLTSDGKLLCFASDRRGGQGGLDIYLYDRINGKFLPMPGLNSPGHEQTPFISQDGRWIAFVSERFGSAGEHDIFVYDRSQQRLIETPGLNTDRDDFDPCLITVGTK